MHDLLFGPFIERAGSTLIGLQRPDRNAAMAAVYDRYPLVASLGSVVPSELAFLPPIPPTGGQARPSPHRRGRSPIRRNRWCRPLFDRTPSPGG